MLISTSVAIAERNSQRGFYILRQISHLTNDLIISLHLTNQFNNNISAYNNSISVEIFNTFIKQLNYGITQLTAFFKTFLVYK